MGKSIVKKKSIDIKGVLNIGDDMNANNIYVEVEDIDEPLLLSDLIKSFNGCEVSISVRESIEGA